VPNVDVDVREFDACRNFVLQPVVRPVQVFASDVQRLEYAARFDAQWQGHSATHLADLSHDLSLDSEATASHSRKRDHISADRNGRMASANQERAVGDPTETLN
jgi:hypothetical protein